MVYPQIIPYGGFCKMKIVGHEFVKSERRKCFSDAEVAYLKRAGFLVGTRKDNFVYMVKPVKAIVTVETEGGFRITQDMREQILRYYNLDHLKVERFNMFLADAMRGKIRLSVTSDGEIVITR